MAKNIICYCNYKGNFMLQSWTKWDWKNSLLEKSYLFANVVFMGRIALNLISQPRVEVSVKDLEDFSPFSWEFSVLWHIKLT